MLTARSILRIATPPYLFQPLQILRRLRVEFFRLSKRQVWVNLPWGLPLRIDLQEAIGFNIACQGLYEMGVTEALWRLTEPGDLAVDAGSNIGYSASILGLRVGPKGRVLCFEPHPEVFESLKENLDSWKQDRRCGSFHPQRIALGAENGEAKLHTSDWFRTNRGTAWISSHGQTTCDVRIIDVPLRKLDTILSDGEKIGILKMDVEGSELEVLLGMPRLLEQQAVRDIVFEEESPFPARTHKFLKSKGYSVFGLQELFVGVRCLVDAQPRFHPTFAPIPTYLATLEPERATALLGPPIWRSFGFGRLLPPVKGGECCNESPPNIENDFNVR
jgi:FkbM family methyltransferase